jgi:hypothetical protein
MRNAQSNNSSTISSLAERESPKKPKEPTNRLQKQDHDLLSTNKQIYEHTKIPYTRTNSGVHLMSRGELC